MQTFKTITRKSLVLQASVLTESSLNNQQRVETVAIKPVASPHHNTYSADPS